jgi:hypothetical protein
MSNFTAPTNDLTIYQFQKFLLSPTHQQLHNEIFLTAIDIFLTKMLSFGIKTFKNANLYFEIPRAYEAFNLTVAVNNAINYSSSS